MYEGDETVVATLTGGTGYTVSVADGVATGTIIDNDSAPVASIEVNPASVDEDGAINLVYTVTLDHASDTDTVIGINWSRSEERSEG